MSGTILRRRDRTARPPRVEHYSSAVNTWPESLPVTYEAPPDNYHKVVRLHGTTESLPLTRKDSVVPWRPAASAAGKLPR